MARLPSGVDDARTGKTDALRLKTTVSRSQTNIGRAVIRGAERIRLPASPVVASPEAAARADAGPSPERRCRLCQRPGDWHNTPSG
jgi:hypothetical protein